MVPDLTKLDMQSFSLPIFLTIVLTANRNPDPFFLKKIKCFGICHKPIPGVLLWVLWVRQLVRTGDASSWLKTEPYVAGLNLIVEDVNGCIPTATIRSTYNLSHVFYAKFKTMLLFYDMPPGLL